MNARKEGDLVNTIEREFDRIGHIQVADNPGRREPGTGKINYPFVLRPIGELGLQGLDWLRIQAPGGGKLTGVAKREATKHLKR